MLYTIRKIISCSFRIKIAMGLKMYILGVINVFVRYIKTEYWLFIKGICLNQ